MVGFQPLTHNKQQIAKNVSQQQPSRSIVAERRSGGRVHLQTNKSELDGKQAVNQKLEIGKGKVRKETSQTGVWLSVKRPVRKPFHFSGSIQVKS